MEMETEDDLSFGREWDDGHDQEKVLKSKQGEEINLTPVCGSPEVEQTDVDGEKKEDEVVKETMSSDEDDDQSLSVELQHGKRILNELMSDANKSANWPFMNAVEENDVPDYYERISNPMWLRKIKEKFRMREYNTITEFVSDFRLMLENCFRYNGPDHYVSKRGQRLETMMEQKLTLLSRDLREKTSITATSGGHCEDQPTCTSLRRRNRSLLPHDSSGLLTQLRHEELMRERELRKQQTLDRKAAQEAYMQELQAWEDRLLEEPLHEQLKAMWEIPQIGHFLFLCQDVLNLDEVIHYELERCFLLARESSTMQRVMTSLLSTPYQRRNLDNKPFMPYKIWEEKLRVRTRQWYKALEDADQDCDKAASKLGIDSMFFRVSGKRNPLEKRKFHELSFYRKVWIMKTLCDHCLETQDSVREAIEAQIFEEQRSYELGVDKDGTTYLHFPQFCGADLRLYRQDKAPMPVIQREIQTMVYKKKNVKRSSTYKFPAPIPKKKKKKKVFRPPAPAVITPSRPSHLRQHIKAVIPLGCAVQSDDSDDTSSDDDDDDEGSKGTTGSGYFTHTKSNLDIRQPIGLPTFVTRNDGDEANHKNKLNSKSSGKTPLKNSSRISCKKGNNGISKEILNALDSNKDSPQSADAMEVEDDESSVVSCEPQENDDDDDDASTDCYIGDDGSSTSGSLFTSNNNKIKDASSEIIKNAVNICDSQCTDDLPSENDVANKHESLYSKNSNDAKILDCLKCVNIDHKAAIQSRIAQCEHLHNPLTKGASVTKPSNADNRTPFMSSHSSDVEKTVSEADPSVVPCNQDASQASCNGNLKRDCAEDGHLHLDDVEKEIDVDLYTAGNIAKHPLKSEPYSILDVNDARLCMTADSSTHDIANTDHIKHDLVIENSENPDVTRPEPKTEYIKQKFTIVKCEPNSMEYGNSNSKDTVCVKSYIDERTACSADDEFLVNEKPRINNEPCNGDSREQFHEEDKRDEINNLPEKPSTFNDNDKTPVASDKVDVLPADDCKKEQKQSDEKLCIEDGKKAQIVVKTEPKEEDNIASNEKTSEGADELKNEDKELVKELEEEDEEEELTPEIGPFELLVENVEGLRQLIDDMQSKESPEASSRRQKVPPTKRSINLCINLQYLLKELEPWETKLIQANKRAKLKLRREQETYVEEPEVASPNPNVWDSEESVSESSDNEATSESVDKSSQPKVASAKKVAVVVEQPSIIPHPDDDSNSSISLRGRLRKRRFIPNNVEDQMNRKRKSIKKEEPDPTTTPNHVPNILQRHSAKVVPSNKKDGSSGNVLQLSLEQLKSLTSQGVLQVATSQGNILLQSSSQPTSLPGNILGTSPKKLSTYGFSINRKQLKQETTAVSAGNNLPVQHFITTKQLTHPVMQQLLANAKSIGLSSSLTLANVAALHASTQSTSASILSPRIQAASSLIRPDNKANPTWSYLAIKSKKDTSAASSTPGASSITTATMQQNTNTAICAQAAKSVALSSPEKTTSKVQYFNTINTLPSNVMQQLLRHPGVKLQTTGVATATQNIAQRPNVPLHPRILSQVKVQQPAMKLEPGVVRAPSELQQSQQLRLQASGLLGLRQGAVHNPVLQVPTHAPALVNPSRMIMPVVTKSAIDIRQINPTPIKAPSTTSLCLSMNLPVSSIMQPVSVSTTMQLTSPIMSTSSGQGVLTLSPHRPKYACNLTVKYLLENRTNKSEGDTPEQSVVLDNGEGITSTSITGINSNMDSALQTAVTNVSSSLVTVKAPAPITMPSINPRKNTTCTIQSMKAPIAVTPKLEFKASTATTVPTHPMGQTSVTLVPAQNTITVVQKAADGKNVLLKVVPQNILTTQGLVHGYLTPQGCIFPQSNGLTNEQPNVSQAQVGRSTATVTSPSITVAQQPMLIATMAKDSAPGNSHLGIQSVNLKSNPGVLQNAQVSVQQQPLLQNPSVSLNSAQLYTLVQKAMSNNQLQLAAGVQSQPTTLNVSQQQLKNMLALSQQNLQGSQLIQNSGQQTLQPVMMPVSQILHNKGAVHNSQPQAYLKTSSTAISPQSANAGNAMPTGNVASEIVRQMTASHLQSGVDRFTLKSPQNVTVPSGNTIHLQQQLTSSASSATLKTVPTTTLVHAQTGGSITTAGQPLPKATKQISHSLTGQQGIGSLNINQSSAANQSLGTHLLSSSNLHKTTATTFLNVGGTTALATTVAHQVVPPIAPTTVARQLAQPATPRMTSPVQSPNIPAQKLILYNVGGQLVTAQGVPVTLDNGVLKIMPQGMSTINSRVITPQIPSTSGSVATGQLASIQNNTIKPPQQSALNIVKQEPNQVVSPAQVSLRVQPSPFNCLNIAIPQSTGQDGVTMLPVVDLQNVSVSHAASAGMVMPAAATDSSIRQSNPANNQTRAQLKPPVAVLSTAATPLQTASHRKPPAAVLSPAASPLQTPSHLKPPVAVVSPAATPLQTAGHLKPPAAVLSPTATPLQIQSHLPQPTTLLAPLASPLTASRGVSSVVQHSMPQQNSGNLGMLVGQGLRAMISPGNIVQTPLQFGILASGNNPNAVAGLQMLISPGKSPQNVLLSSMNLAGSSHASSAVIESSAAIGQKLLSQTGINHTSVSVTTPIMGSNSYPALAMPIIINSSVQTAGIPGQTVVRPQRQGPASCTVINSTKIPVASPNYSTRPVGNSVSSNPAGVLHASSGAQQVLSMPPHMTAFGSNTAKPDNSTISHNVLLNSASATGNLVPSRVEEVKKSKENVSGNSKPVSKRSAVEESAAKILSSIAEARVNEIIQSNNRLLQSVNKPAS